MYNKQNFHILYIFKFNKKKIVCMTFELSSWNFYYEIWREFHYFFFDLKNAKPILQNEPTGSATMQIVSNVDKMFYLNICWNVEGHSSTFQKVKKIINKFF